MPTRTPVLNGTWYPGDSDALREMVDGFLATAVPTERPAGRPLVAIVPHAGYQYSGPTAGRLYGLLPKDSPARVLILAPSHRKPLYDIALTDSTAFETPLGEVPVDQAFTARLAARPNFAHDTAAHQHEHAIEIQLPFLQRLWPQGGFRIVPMLVPVLPEDRNRAAAAALAAEIDEDTLVLVSTDFTHYGANYGYLPFKNDIPASLEKLDSGAILRILAADGDGLRDYGTRTGITMCGLAAAGLALDAGLLPEGYEGALIDYRRSGDRDGNYDFSVSYASILLTGGPAGSREDGHE